MAAPFSNTHDSASISTTEYSIVDKTTASVPIAHTTPCCLTVLFGLGNMVAGDAYTFRIYEKVNGQTAKPIWEVSLSGVQPGPLVSPTFPVDEGWDITVIRTAGADRTIHWAIKQDFSDTPDVVRQGTAQAGAAQSITLDSGASATDGLYYGAIITLRGGAGAGQSRRIVGYTGSSKVAVVDSAWATNPDSTTTFVIVGGAQTLNLPTHKAITGTLTATAFTTDLTETTNDHWKDAFCRFISGSLAGQVKKITSYTGSSKTLNFTSGFTGAPSNGDLFVVVNG